MSTRLAVLCSGGGSNLQAILDYVRSQPAPRRTEVVLVATDRAGAGALVRARDHSIASTVMDAQTRSTGMLGLLRSHSIEYVALAGYLRFIPNDVTEAFRGRLVNIHPALLPAFGGPGMYGHHVHDAVIKAGVRVTGATVHFVDGAYDHGPIIAQWPVPVLSEDTTETLAGRVLEVEHALFPPLVVGVAAGEITLGADGRVEGRVRQPRSPYFAMSQTPGIALLPSEAVPHT